jgi:hypothetical protein
VGSVRNPVGPLPSSIYWRRRAVVLCLLALVIAIIVWALNSGGGGGGTGHSAPTGSHTPVASITPGPDPGGTHIGGRPGGRGTAPSDGGAGDGSSGGTGTDGGAGTASDAGASAGGSGGGTAGSAGADGSGGTAGASGGGGGTAGSGGAPAGPAPLPAGTSLPDCAPGAIRLTLTSASNVYAPGDTPAFLLRAANSGATNCKIDFGPRQAVFTVTAAAGNRHVWASDDCPSTGAYLLEVPAHSATTYTLRWNEKTSAPNCASPEGRQAPPGTYLVQAALPGHAAEQASFVLSAD